MTKTILWQHSLNCFYTAIVFRNVLLIRNLYGFKVLLQTILDAQIVQGTRYYIVRPFEYQKKASSSLFL